MNKMQEDFEQRARNMGYDLSMEGDHYIDHNTMQLELGYLMAVEDWKKPSQHQREDMRDE